MYILTRWIHDMALLGRMAIRGDGWETQTGGLMMRRRRLLAASCWFRSYNDSRVVSAGGRARHSLVSPVFLGDVYYEKHPSIRV